VLGRLPDTDLGEVKNLHAVTCYFNPTNCPYMRANYHEFARRLSVPLITVELSFTGNFDIPGSHRLVGNTTDQLLWQKERLLNYAETLLPPECDAVVWVDADILFDSKDWPEKTLRMLRYNHVGQPYETPYEAKLSDLSHRWPVRQSTCAAYRKGHEDYYHFGKFHPGFVWAMRRDTWRAIGGLLESCVVGNGDIHMCRGFFDVDLWNDRVMNSAWANDADRWRSTAWSVIRGRVGFVPGLITHLWHGDRANRKYIERLTYLGHNGYNPPKDLIRKGELLSWSPYAMRNKKRMVSLVHDYFEERNHEQPHQ